MSTSSSHRSIFSRLSVPDRSSSSASVSSASSRSSTPAGARDFRLQYAKDSKGHEMSSSYAYSTSSVASSLHGEAQKDGIPTSSRDSLTRLRYAKDARGNNLSTSYPYYSLSAEDEAVLVLSSTPAMPNGCQDFNKRQSQSKKLINRYAKDGKQYDFNASYPYTTSAMKT